MTRSHGTGVLAIAAAVGALVLPGVASAAPVQVHVAPWGNDGGPGTAAHPYETIERAQQRVRAETPTMDSNVVVNLHGGTYRLDEPLQLSNAAGDSGANGHRVIWQAHRYGTNHQHAVTVSGGTEIDGWSQVGTSPVWQAEVGDLDTRQLFVDGVRAYRAALGSGLPGEVTVTETGFVTDSLEPQSWTTPEDVEFRWTAFDAFAWVDTRCGVASITGDATSTTITMDQPCLGHAKKLYNIPDFATLANPTDIEGSASFLTEPGTFHLDRSVPGSHVLSYIPRAGEDLSEAEVIAPALEALVEGEGTPAAPLSGVTFRGLTFAHSTWLGPNLETGFPHVFANYYELEMPPPGDFTTSDAATVVPAAVSFLHATRLRLEDNRFEHLGAQAVGVDGHSARVRVRGNVITDVSGGGVQLVLTKPNRAPEVTTQASRRHRVENNWIHDIGVEYNGSPAIYLAENKNTVVAHNQVNRAPYSGIVVTGEPPGDSLGGVRVRRNHVFDVIRTLLDGAGIYVANAASGPLDTLVKGNVVHEARNVDDSILNYGANGLYPDYGVKNLTFAENVSYANGNAALQICNVVPFTNFVARDNFWDMEPYNPSPEYCGEPDEEFTFENNTVLSPETFEASCLAIAACATILDHAGLQPAYQHLLD